MIMFPSAKVLAIDDDENDLNNIRDGLHAAGIACVPIHFTLPLPDLAPAQGVRIVFLDLNLVGGHRNAAELADIAGQALKRYLATGPYLLVFWSVQAADVDEVVRLLKVRHADAPAPLAVGVMDKAELRLPEQTAEDYDTRLDALKQRILREVAKSPQLVALLHWEAKLAESAGKAFGELSTLAAGANPWDFDSVEGRFRTILGKIARESGGVHADDNRAKAMQRGLAPLLDDFMGAIPTDEGYNSVWKAATPEPLGPCGQLPEGVSSAQLNTRYLYDLIVPLKDERGALVEIPEDAAWEAHFGYGREQLVSLSLNLEEMTDAQGALSRCRCFLLECSTACDYAQGNERLLRYVFCTLVPSGKLKTKKGKRVKECHQGIYRFPILKIGDEDVILEANFRHVLGLPSGHAILGTPLLRVRPQALDAMLQQYAHHTSRLGLLSFH
ncbi:hypothetical protein [Humidesulfovibrio mexicanus]|nr:hypothetical protein [Humidesulfovibrio mexicanus]